MNHTTRDNLIYLAVGLGIVGILVADFTYFDRRGQQAWFPSVFSFRAVVLTILVAYFVNSDIVRRGKGEQARALICALLAALIQIGVAFSFRQFVSGLSAMSFVFYGTLDVFVIYELTLQAAQFLKFGRGHRRT